MITTSSNEFQRMEVQEDKEKLTARMRFSLRAQTCVVCRIVSPSICLRVSLIGCRLGGVDVVGELHPTNTNHWTSMETARRAYGALDDLDDERGSFRLKDIPLHMGPEPGETDSLLPSLPAAEMQVGKNRLRD